MCLSGGRRRTGRWSRHQRRRRSNFSMPPVRFNVAMAFRSPPATLRRTAASMRSNGIVHGSEQPPSVRRGAGRRCSAISRSRARAVGGSPAQPGLIEVVLDRNAETSELGQVRRPAAGGSELEVEQRNGDAVTEDDVRELHVVVAHDGPALQDPRAPRSRCIPGSRTWRRRRGARAAAWRPTPARCRTGSSRDRAARGRRRR